MFGHWHTETFRVNMAFNTTQATGVQLETGSVTTGGGRNPSFVVIDFDEEYMVPTNIHTYYMNLTQANANPDEQPKWEYLHDFLEEYSLPDLSPSSMKDFSNKMYGGDLDLASQFLWNKQRRVGAKPSANAHDLQFKCLQATESF